MASEDYDPRPLHDPRRLRLAAKGAPPPADDDKDDDDDKDKAKPGAGKTDDGKPRAGKIEDKDDDDKDDDKQGGNKKAGDKKDDDDDKPETPDSRFEDRYPQTVRVSDVVGKPLIATDNASIGMIQAVVKTPDGKLRLIVPVGGFLGFGRRLVAVPNELVGSIGTAIVSIDMDHTAYLKAPTWTQGSDVILAPDSPMRVAITRH